VGVIRYRALVAAAEAEASMSMQTMVGVSKEERALSRVSFAVRQRLPWLEINLATAFLAAFVVGLFEGTIAKYTALAVLLPVVAGLAGASIPLIMKALGQDPAQSSSIVLTTVTDVTGFLSFLGLATLFSAFL